MLACFQERRKRRRRRRHGLAGFRCKDNRRPPWRLNRSWWFWFKKGEMGHKEGTQTHTFSEKAFCLVLFAADQVEATFRVNRLKGLGCTHCYNFRWKMETTELVTDWLLGSLASFTTDDHVLLFFYICVIFIFKNVNPWVAQGDAVYCDYPALNADILTGSYGFNALLNGPQKYTPPPLFIQLTVPLTICRRPSAMKRLPYHSFFVTRLMAAMEPTGANILRTIMQMCAETTLPV